jgi:hypothetical protein
VGDEQGIERARCGFEDRLDAMGWGVLLVVVGAVLLAPGLPGEAWLVAAGTVMLGTTLVRTVLGVAVPWITAVIGTAAFVGGGAGIVGLESAAWPLVLIALGVVVTALGFYRADRGATFASDASTRR